MKILHLSKHDVSGGAARAAFRLHKGLEQIGEASMMAVASKSSADAAVVSIQAPKDFSSRIGRGLREYRIDREFNKYRATRPEGLDLFSNDRSGIGPWLPALLPRCDVINLHWIPGFVDYQSILSEIPGATPIVWTLHDMNAFTGGCHYNLGCDHYKDRCGRCPQLGSVQPGDLSAQVWSRKQRAFDRTPLKMHVVAPSRWLADEARSSPMLRKFPVSCIPYGLPLDEFAPRDRAAARKLLNIPATARVILFVAERVDNQRKNFALLAAALRECAETIPDLLLLSLGHGRPAVDERVPSVHLGGLDNDRFLSIVYSAADVFVITSLQDNLPNTVLEALACGVPVIGVKVGGIPDMVRDGITGVTTEPEPLALASAIRDLLHAPERRMQMSADCRRISEREYPLDRQAREYVEIYKSLL